MNSNFLQYNKTNINENKSYKSNKPIKSTYNNNYNICLKECELNENCKGVVFSNPLCDKDNTFSECINMFTDIDILNSEPKNLYKSKCKFLSNIDNSSKVYSSEKNKSFIKNKYVNMLDSQINTSKYYYLKINNKYLGISDKLNSLFLVGVENINEASLFRFNSNGNIIELKSSKCLQSNGNYIILTDCDMTTNRQKYIYENKYNSIRNNNNNLMLCMGLKNKSNEKINNITKFENNIVLEECDNSLAQKVINELENKQIDEYENFKSIRNRIENRVNNTEYCSNPIYKTIVFIVLVSILIYFIWFVSRKQYGDPIEPSDLVSTPFHKNS